jgi:hypothetical protein
LIDGGLGRRGPRREAGDVLLHRLDALGQDFKLVELGRTPPGDGRLVVTSLLLDLLRRARRVVCRDRFQVFSHDEGLALRQRLWMGEDPLHLVATCARHCQQAVVDLQRDLGHHQRSILEQEIVGLEDAAPLRVFDRDEGEVDRLVGHPVKGMPKGAEGLRGR